MSWPSNRPPFAVPEDPGEWRKSESRGGEVGIRISTGSSAGRFARPRRARTSFRSLFLRPAASCDESMRRGGPLRNALARADGRRRQGTSGGGTRAARLGDPGCGRTSFCRPGARPTLGNPTDPACRIASAGASAAQRKPVWPLSVVVPVCQQRVDTVMNRRPCQLGGTTSSDVNSLYLVPRVSHGTHPRSTAGVKELQRASVRGGWSRRTHCRRTIGTPLKRGGAGGICEPALASPRRPAAGARRGRHGHVRAAGAGARDGAAPGGAYGRRGAGAEPRAEVTRGCSARAARVDQSARLAVPCARSQTCRPRPLSHATFVFGSRDDFAWRDPANEHIEPLGYCDSKSAAEW